MNLTYDLIKEDNQATIKLTGELDGFNRTELSEQLDQLIGETQEIPITLDLSKLSFIDSIGLGLIAKTAKKLQSMDRKLILKQVPSHINRLIQSSGIMKFLAGSLEIVE